MTNFPNESVQSGRPSSVPSLPGVTRTRRALRVAVLAVFSACLWLGWFAWDTEQDLDPATGTTSGPYEAWQVLGCVASWLVLAWFAARMLTPWPVIVTMPAAFTAAFVITAMRSDESGLWAVGAVLILLGTLAGTAALVAVLTRRTRGLHTRALRKGADPAGSHGSSGPQEVSAPR